MERTLARNWWAIALRGAFAILFGLIAFAWAESTPSFLGTVFGVFLLIEGGLAACTTLGAHTKEERVYVSLVEGGAGFAFGMVLLSGIHDAGTVVKLVAAWVACIGMLEGASALTIHKHLASPRLLMAVAAASLILASGIWIFSPDVFVAVWFIGAWAIYFGATNLFVSFSLRVDVGADKIHPFRPSLS